MIGSDSFELDWKAFVEGMTSSTNTTDGGFSVGIGNLRSYGVNLTVNPGVLYFQPTATDRSTNLVGNLVAHCEDPNTVSPVNKLFLATKTSTEDGTFYTFNGSTLTLVATDTIRKYRYGISDMAPLGTYVYGTSATSIFEWQVSGGIVTQNYYDLTTTYANASLVPHPTLQFENNWFCGNGNVLLRLTATGGIPTVVLTLDTSQVIVALGIDPGTGKMLLSTTTAPNKNDTDIRTNKVLYYDGFSNKVLKSVLVDDMIMGFYPTGATLYVGYGQNLGYWTGTGIQFVRKLTIALSAEQLLYRPHFTNTGSTLYVTDGNYILAYGVVVQGIGPSFRYVYRDSTHTIGMICNLGNNVLGIGTTTANLFSTLDTSSTATLGTADLYSVRANFPRKVIFKSVIIEYFDPLPSDGTTVGVVSLVTEQGALVAVKTITNTIVNNYVVECPYPTFDTRMIQFNYTPSQNIGIRRMTVFHSPKE